MPLLEFGPTYPDNLLGRLRRLGSALAREDRLVDRLVSPIRRPVDRAYYRHSAKLRELDELGESAERLQRAATGKRVLVLSLRMWADHMAYESVIAHALRLRGADVTMLTCGGGQPICEVGWGRRIAPRPCDRCAYLPIASQAPHGFPSAASPTSSSGVHDRIALLGERHRRRASTQPSSPLLPSPGSRRARIPDERVTERQSRLTSTCRSRPWRKPFPASSNASTRTSSSR